MAPRSGSKSNGAANRPTDTSAFVDDYLADWDIFRSPSPEGAKDRNEKEKKKTDVLGIEQQLNLKRKPRAPRVKLDEARLLSDNGIPRLRKMAPKLKFKGKGHEFSDAARLLSFYQEWLDDLFPKATFLDALAMVEKAGHKTTMRNARLKWIDEAKPKATVEDQQEEEYAIHLNPPAPSQPDRIAPVFEQAAQAAKERARTPAEDDLFGDVDLYNATPRRNAGSSTAPSRQVATGDVPDGDDLDALMAEVEAEAESSGRTTERSVPGPASAPLGSIFGNGSSSRGAPPTGGREEDDDLDALMAEAEAEVQPRPARPDQPAGSGVFEDAKSTRQTTQESDGRGDDLDALMAEMEAEAEGEGEVASQARREKEASSNSADPEARSDRDDQDALMAEAEGEAGTKDAPKALADAGGPVGAFEDEEDAMAEMDGLW